MWKQWQIEGGKEKSEENAKDEKEVTLSKVDKKVKSKGKDYLKDKDKKRETRSCNHCGMKGHIEVNCQKKHPSLTAEKFKGKKTEKAGAAIEEEHLLSMVDIFNDVIIFCVETSINNGFGNVTDKDDILDLEARTECGKKRKCLS